MHKDIFKEWTEKNITNHPKYEAQKAENEELKGIDQQIKEIDKKLAAYAENDNDQHLQAEIKAHSQQFSDTLKYHVNNNCNNSEQINNIKARLVN